MAASPRESRRGPGALPRSPGGSGGERSASSPPRGPQLERRGAAAARGQRDSRSKLQDLAEAAAWGGWCRGEGTASHLQPLMTFLEIVSPPPWQPRTRRRGGQGRGCAGGGQGHAVGGRNKDGPERSCGAKVGVGGERGVKEEWGMSPTRGTRGG